MRNALRPLVFPRLARLVTLLIVAWLVPLTLSACGDDTSSSADIIPIDSDAEDGGVDIVVPDLSRDLDSDEVLEDSGTIEPDADLLSDAEASEVLEDSTPDLPPCVRACDVVVDCGVELCEGIDWQTAGLAYNLCDEACDEAFAAEVLTAAESGCEEVAPLIVAQVPELDALCSSDLCQMVCERIAVCAVAECSLLEESSHTGLYESCVSGCQPSGELGGLLNLSCPQVVELLDDDPGFAAACEPSACPSPVLCAGFAEKSTSCILAHCEGNADPYQQGIRELIATYCTSDPQCPSADDLPALLEPAITCEDEPFVAFGPAPPFTVICAGSVGVDHADLVTACQGLVVCNFEVGTIQQCALSLALSEDPVSLEACLSAATNCTQAGECFAGP